MAWRGGAGLGTARHGAAGPGTAWEPTAHFLIHKGYSMRESIDEITAAVESLVRMSAGYDRGQIVAWDEVEAISGSRRENRGRHIINKWRKRLEREREIITLVADNVGVRLLTHKEAAHEIPRLRQRKAYRQIRRAIKQTSLVDDSQLSIAERKLLAAQRNNMVVQRRELFRSQKQLEKATAATEVNPRRVVVKT